MQLLSSIADLKDIVNKEYIDSILANYVLSANLGALATKDSLAFSDLTSRPSKLSDFTDDVVSGKYLPLTGGTISGTSVAPLIINTSASESSVVFRINSDSKTQIGYNPYLGSFIYNYSSSKSIGITDDGTPHYNGNTIYHAGNFNPADYLPLSGGTITKRNDGAALIINTPDTSWAGIRFKPSISSVGATLTYSEEGWGVSDEGWTRHFALVHSGNVGDYALPSSGGTLTGGLTISSGNLIVSASGGDTVTNKIYPTADNTHSLGQNGRRWSDIKTVLINGGTPIHSNNYSSYALPLTGGTITRNLIIASANDSKIVLNETGEDYKYQLIEFQDHGTMYGVLGTMGSGDLVWNGSTIIHSGNIGSQSVDAANVLSTSYSENINYSSYTSQLKLIRSTDGNAVANGFPFDYVSGLSVMAGYVGWQMVIYGDWASNPNPRFRSVGGAGDWSPWKTIAFTDSTVDKAKSVVDASGNALTLVHSGNVGDYALKKVANVTSLNTNAGEFFYSGFRPAHIPYGNYVGGITLQTFRDAENDYRTQLAFSTDAKGFVRSYINGSWYDWKTIAFTDSNVASATKLATARTIWGQSFDGTGNVSGTLKNVSWIELTGTNFGIYQGSALNSALTDNDIALYSQKVYMSGNVGIGTTDPKYTLDVNGPLSTPYYLSFRNASDSEFSYIGRGGSAEVLTIMTYGAENPLNFGTNSKTRMYINGDGNVTIGSSDLAGTSYALCVNGVNKFYDKDNTLKLYTKIKGCGVQIGRTTSAYTGGYNGGVTIGEDDSNLGFIAGAYNESTGSSKILFHYGGSSQNDASIYIKGISGNVGIANANPAYKLDVNGDIGTSGEVFLNHNKAIRMKGSNGTDYNVLFKSGTDLNIGYDSPVIRFGGSKMFINSSSNVTIGGSDLAGTSAKLYVDGDAYISTRLAVGNSSTLSPNYTLYVGGNGKIKASTKSGIDTTTIKNSAILELSGSKEDALFIGQQSNSDMWMQAAYQGTTAYPSQNHTYNLLLQPLGGNVGIGTNNPAYKLDVAGSIRTTSSLTIGTIVLTDENGTLKIAGNIYTTGQLGAGEAGQPTSGGGSVHYWSNEYDMDIGTDVLVSSKEYIGTNTIVGWDLAGSCLNDLYIGYDGYTIWMQGSVDEASDMRLKTVIDAVNLDIKDIAYAPIFNYVFKSRPQGRQMLGSSAQYWQAIAPKAVSENDKGNLAMNYGAIALASVVAVAKKVVTHEEEIAELKSKVQSLETRLAKYELN